MRPEAVLQPITFKVATLSKYVVFVKRHRFYCAQLVELCNTWRHSAPEITAREITINTIQKPPRDSVELHDPACAVEQNNAVPCNIEDVM